MSPAPATLEEVLAILRQDRASLQAEAGVEFVGLVGSLARGEARPDSDVDIVFNPAAGFDYMRLGGLIMKLREFFRRPVDLVDREMVRPERWAWMSRDLVAIA